MSDPSRFAYGLIVHRCRRRFWAALAFALAFKALNLILLAPLAAVMLRFFLSLWGRASVGNFELAVFLLSPAGLAALFAVGGVLLASLYLELAGLLRIVTDDRPRWWQVFAGSTRLFPRLVHLGVRQLALYLALAVPFLAAIGLVYWLFWSGRDLNGLIILRPPAFWWGAGCAAALAAVYAFFALRLFLCQLYAVPILVLEPGVGIHQALASSTERSRGVMRRSAAALGLWLAILLAISAIVMGGLHYLLYLVVQRSSTSISLLVVATGVVLVTETAVAILLSVLVDISLVGVVLALYRQSAPFEVLSGHEAPQPATVNETAKASPRVGSLGWKLGAFLATGVALTVAAGALWVRGLKLHDGFEITAHRAGATAAPENTVAAIRQAILDQADWAEIDVQLTADQALVVMHDIDLARVGGGNRRVDQATLAEIQSLDVGAAFGPQFAGEQIPTLAEILAAAGDRIRLNVELKPHSRQNARDLTRRVVAEIQEKGMTHRCRICSQSYESLQLARQIEPSFEVGFIVATAVGDLTRLDVNFLMVERKLASRRLVDRARVSGLDVHAWTVNDPSQVASLLDAGIANLITDDPAVMRARLEEIRGLDTLERLLLRASHALAR